MYVVHARTGLLPQQSRSHSIDSSWNYLILLQYPFSTVRGVRTSAAKERKKRKKRWELYQLSLSAFISILSCDRGSQGNPEETSYFPGLLSFWGAFGSGFRCWLWPVCVQFPRQNWLPSFSSPSPSPSITVTSPSPSPPRHQHSSF